MSECDIKRRHVILEVDKCLTLVFSAPREPHWRNRKRRVIGLGYRDGRRRKSNGGGSLGASGSAFRECTVKRESSVRRAHDYHTVRRNVRNESGDIVAPYGPAAEVARQSERRIPSSRNC